MTGERKRQIREKAFETKGALRVFKEDKEMVKDRPVAELLILLTGMVDLIIECTEEK